MATGDLCARRARVLATSATRFGWVARRLLGVTVPILLLAGLAAAALGQTQAVSQGLAPSLCSTDVFALKDRLGSPAPVSESLRLVRELALAGPQFQNDGVLAFEENKLFIYAVAGAAKGGRAAGGGPGAEESPSFLRRFVLLKPAILVIDDHVGGPASQGPRRWLFRSTSPPEVAGARVRIAESDREILCETLLPGKVGIRITRQAGDAAEAEHVVEMVPEGGSPEVRFVHVLQVRALNEQGSPARSELSEEEGRVQLTVSTSDRVFRLTLPPPRLAAGEIEIADAQNELLLARRLLPAGILPYGPEGTQLLERWDSAYRGDRRPGWDTGRPSSNLRKAVEDGTLRPCRAVELGCGSGTNAIWLAGQGFDVTGVDVAPTALSQGIQKARQAGVSVRWILADVLAPPELEPFDLVFDRGCYHGVRRQNAAGYVESVRRLTRPGARVLILAGNANEPGRGGPPRVKEEELRADFSSHFEFERLEETRFDTANPEGRGALAWFVLLRRKDEP